MSTCKHTGRVSVHCWGLDLPRRGWSSPSYRGSPGRPALSTRFVEHNGALCTDALSRWYNPFTARPLLHSWFLCGSRMAVTAGRRQTPWLATTSTWYEPHWEYVEWGEKDSAGNVACPPSQKYRWAMDPCVRRVGWSCFIYALHSMTDWVHDTTNEISGRSRRVLDFLLKRSISENSPTLLRAKILILIFYA